MKKWFPKFTVMINTLMMSILFFGTTAFAANPATGDTSGTMVTVMIALAAVSVILIIVYFIMSSKKKKKRK